jgi:hypothetical protein
VAVGAKDLQIFPVMVSMNMVAMVQDQAACFSTAVAPRWKIIGKVNQDPFAKQVSRVSLMQTCKDFIERYFFLALLVPALGIIAAKLCCSNAMRRSRKATPKSSFLHSLRILSYTDELFIADLL